MVEIEKIKSQKVLAFSEELFEKVCKILEISTKEVKK